MRISEQFPSKYLSASDLEGEQTVIMGRVEIDKVGKDEERKPILYFEGVDKGMVLNKTNASTIAQLYGDDTSEWVGEAITLFEAMVSFNGETKPAIRVKAASRKKAAAAQAGGSQKKIGAVTADDGIPF